MPMRFLITEPIQSGENIELGADRAHYLSKVMRHKPGDVIACFDGNGTAFDAQLVSVGSKRCTVQITHKAPLAPQPSIQLHLGISLIKGQAMDRAIQQATELGACSIRLLQANRSNVQLSGERMQNKLSHWRKIIAGACEQSGQLYLPTLMPPQSLQDAIGSMDAEVIVLDMLGEKLPSVLPSAERLLLLGPEGGWDESERALFGRHELTHYQISAATLRAETVPAVALALFSHLQHAPSDPQAALQ